MRRNGGSRACPGVHTIDFNRKEPVSEILIDSFLYQLGNLVNSLFRCPQIGQYRVNKWFSYPAQRHCWIYW